MTTPGSNQLSSANAIMQGAGLKGLNSTVVSGPRKITINRILIKAEVRKCFAGIDWESQNLQQIIERISEKLKVYGNVDEGVIASVEEQVRKKLTDKGIVPEQHASSAIPPKSPPKSPVPVVVAGGGANDVNLYSGEGSSAIEDDAGDVNLYDSSEQMLFNPPPPPRVLTGDDALRIQAKNAPTDHKIEEDSSDEEDLYAGTGPASPAASQPSIGFDWSLDKLKKTIEMQFLGATSWRTVINSVSDLDASYKEKIAQELYTKIANANKPFSHEEVGNMALSTLDKMYIELDAGRKRDPTEEMKKRTAAPVPPPSPVPAAVPMQKEGSVSLVGVASADNDLVQNLQRENQALKDEIAKLRIELTKRDNEIGRLNVTISTLEENTKTMVGMLKNKNDEVTDSKKLVSEMSKSNANYSDEGMAVRAQMEEIRQFAIRSQQAARSHSASVAAQQNQQAVLDREIAQQQMILQQRMIEQQIQQEGRASPAPRQASASIPVAAVPHGAKVLPKVDSTIPKELHPIHYPDPQRVGPWQSTTSYTKTKRGTTKAIVTWTLVDSRENRHVLTLEHNHYYWNGKSKRKVIVDNVVRMSEKSGNNSYRFSLPAGDDVTVLINSSSNGYEYELMVNDLTFLESKRFYTDIHNAMMSSSTDLLS